MNYLLGLDIGTSSTKVILIDEAGTVVASATPEYPFFTPRPLWSEANPADWWEATVAGIRAVLAKSQVPAAQVVGIGLSGQMHGLVLLDGQGQVLRPAILWNDQRTGAQCASLTARAGGVAEVIHHTGNPVLAGFTAPKLAWVRENEPEIWASAAKFLLPKDYIRYRLSGEFFGEVSDASGTSLFDVKNRRWSAAMLDATGVPADWLAEITESTVLSTRLSAAAAAATGLVAGTPIAGGGGDQAAQAVGCGIVEEGLVSATFGTSGVVFAHSNTYRVEPQGLLHAFCAAVPGQWHLMGVMLSAAGSLQWFRRQLAAEEAQAAEVLGTDVYDVLTQRAASVAPGAEGLFFLPYLTGERTPHPDPLARGAWIGLTLRHGKAHLTRAVLEGITYGMNDSLSLMRGLGLQPTEILASGGGAKSAFWRQLMADVFQAEIVTLQATEGAALGAALLAGVGVGLYPSVPAACAATLRRSSRTSPGPAAAVYARHYPHYRALYPALKAHFAATGTL